MTGLQKVLVAIAFAAVGVGLYEIQQASRVRELNQRLHQLEAANVELLEQIARERNDATNRLALLMNENESLRENSAELLRLRGMVGRLQADLRDATAAKSARIEGEDHGIPSDPKGVLSRIELLKRAFKQMPERQIPEIQLLTDSDWLRIVEMPMPDLETEASLRRTMSTVRQMAKAKFASRLGVAANAYAAANGGQLPADISMLKSYLDSQTIPMDPTLMRFGLGQGLGRPDFGGKTYPPIDDATLQRYQMIQSGYVEQLRSGQPVIAERAPVDAEYDTLFRIGLRSYSFQGSGENSSLTGRGGSEKPDIESMTPEQRKAYERSLSRRPTPISEPKN